MKVLLTIILAYAASKIVFALFGFSYSPVTDPFHAGKLAIDFGVFIAFYYIFNGLLGLLKPFRSDDGS